MKQRKPLKMFVPESDFIRKDNKELCLLIRDHFGKYLTNVDSGYKITRHEIHELVKAHAEKFGYDYSHISKYAKYVYLNDDGFTQYGSTDSTFNNDVHHKEIKWQDFLKLTPGDVEDKTEHIKSLRGKYKGFFSTTTTDRNEKAWEIYKIVIDGKIKTNDFNPLTMEKYVGIAYMLADEFLKQAGNK